MTAPSLLSFAKDKLLGFESVVSIEQTENTMRFVYVRVDTFTRKELNLLERYDLSFRALETDDDEFRLFCYFTGEFVENGVEYYGNSAVKKIQNYE